MAQGIRLSFKLLIVSSVLILFFYAAFYFYNAGDVTNSCMGQGGICKQECEFGEFRLDACGKQSCCAPVKYDAMNVQIANAIKARDILLCTNADDNVQQQCKILVLDAISSDYALKYEDVKYCENVYDSTMKETCYKGIALKTNNMALCDNIQSDAIYDACYIWFAEKERKWSICTEKVNSDIHRDFCLKTVAIMLKNAAVCGQISIEPEAADCRLKVDLALNTENNVDCAAIPKVQCDSTKGCKAVLVTDPLESLKDVYAGCSRDAEFFCKRTGGSWIVEDGVLMDKERCECGNKAYYEGFGCFDCEKFVYAKDLCLSRLNSQIRE